MRVFLALAALLPLAHGKIGDSCNITGVEPMPLSYGPVTVIDGNKRVLSAHKSLGFVFGSARKLLALGFGTTANATFVPDSDRLCNSSDPKYFGCVFWRGGVFTPSYSETWRKDDRTKPYNGSVSNEGWDFLNGEQYKAMGDDPLAQFTRGWDNMDMGDKTLYSYPFSVIENSSFPFGTGMVGLASDSVFLNISVAEHIAPSRTWGLDYGDMVGEKEGDGELVVGGYNPNRANWDTFTNYTIFPNKSRPCPLQVDVEGMMWGEIDLMKGQDKFMACIEPAYWSIIPPLAVQRNWNHSLVNDFKNVHIMSSWEYFRYNVTGNSTFPDADLEIKLNKGFSVKIPKAALVKPAEWLNEWEGGWVKINDTIDVRMGTAGFLDGVEPKLPFLGGPFLSQVYLTVDYENDVFSLAPIKRDSSSSLPLRKLACDVAPVVTSDKSQGSNNTGAIVGGAVGGAAGLILIVGLLWFFLFRKKQPENTQTPMAEQADPNAAATATAAAAAAAAAAAGTSGDKKDDVPRYSSPFPPYGGYAPPPPESVASTAVAPYGYTASHYSGMQSPHWAGSPPLGPQQLPTHNGDYGAMLPSTRLEPVEMGPGESEVQSPIQQHPDVQEYPQTPQQPQPQPHYSLYPPHQQPQNTGASELISPIGPYMGPPREGDLI